MCVCVSVGRQQHAPPLAMCKRHMKPAAAPVRVTRVTVDAGLCPAARARALLNAWCFVNKVLGTTAHTHTQHTHSNVINPQPPPKKDQKQQQTKRTHADTDTNQLMPVGESAAPRPMPPFDTANHLKTHTQKINAKTTPACTLKHTHTELHTQRTQPAATVPAAAGAPAAHGLHTTPPTVDSLPLAHGDTAALTSADCWGALHGCKGNSENFSTKNPSIAH